MDILVINISLFGVF